MAADVFQVLAESRRREVLALLADRERTAGDIAARFDVTRQAISQHLRILLEAGLIRERREGARRWYRARPEGLEEVRAYVEAMWPDALGRLKTAAEREHASGRRDAERN
jgi:DNA-binding transcriptional ArsR family regulator